MSYLSGTIYSFLDSPHFTLCTIPHCFSFGVLSLGFTNRDLKLFQRFVVWGHFMGSEHHLELFTYTRNDGDADRELPSSCLERSCTFSLFLGISNVHFMYPFAVSTLLTCFTSSSLSDGSGTTISTFLRSVWTTDLLCYIDGGLGASSNISQCGWVGGRSSFSGNHPHSL